jgi:hypothetical protein
MMNHVYSVEISPLLFIGNLLGGNGKSVSRQRQRQSSEPELKAQSSE